MTVTDDPTTGTPPPADTKAADDAADNSEAVRVLQTTSKALELRTLDDKIRYASTLANASLLPDAYRGRDANVLYAIEVGAMLGLHPMAAISNIHIIKNKPSMSAGLMQGQARSKGGHKVRVWATTDERGFPVGHCQIIRCDDPDFLGFKTTFTIDDAVRAGLCEIRSGNVIFSRTDKNEKTNWEKWPRSMVKHRAVSECVRDACPEVLMGVMYTHEEMGAEVDEQGNFMAYPADSPEGAREARTAAFSAAQAAPADDDIAEAEIVDAAEQHGRLMAEMAEMAEILGLPFDEAMTVVAARVHAPDDQPNPDIGPGQVRQVLEEATPEQIIAVLGPLRGAIANKLHEAGRYEEASAYIRAGTREIWPVERLFGRPPQAPPLPPYPPQDTPAPDTAQGAGPDAGSDAGSDDGPTGAPGAAAPAAGGGEPEETVEPHPFDAREDDPDSCASCKSKAHEPIHDPMRGM